MTAGVHTALAGLKPSADTATAQEQIREAAQAYLDKRMKYGGLAFRYELNAVIGGVGAVEVTRVDLLPLPTASGMQRFYVLHLTFRDAYDFDNARSGVYDVYRKKLAKLLADGRYPDFWEAYGRETIGLGYTGLDRRRSSPRSCTRSRRLAGHPARYLGESHRAAHRTIT